MLARPLVPKHYVAAGAGGARLVFLIVAAWYLVFSLPALLFLRERSTRRGLPEGGYLRGALRELGTTIRALRRYRAVAIFLVAFFLYNDGIVTVIQFTGVFTHKVLGFTPDNNVVLFLILNVIAAPGALLFGSLVDRIGGRRAISFSLVVWMGVVVGASMVHTKAQFWPVAIGAAVVIGATQASSRALMAKLAPALGPASSWASSRSAERPPPSSGRPSTGRWPRLRPSRPNPGRGHRVAILAIGALFLVALFVLSRVDEAQGIRVAQEEPDA